MIFRLDNIRNHYNILAVDQTYPKYASSHLIYIKSTNSMFFIIISFLLPLLLTSPFSQKKEENISSSDENEKLFGC